MKLSNRLSFCLAFVWRFRYGVALSSMKISCGSSSPSLQLLCRYPLPEQSTNYSENFKVVSFGLRRVTAVIRDVLLGKQVQASTWLVRLFVAPSHGRYVFLAQSTYLLIRMKPEEFVSEQERAATAKWGLHSCVFTPGRVLLAQLFCRKQAEMLAGAHITPMWQPSLHVPAPSVPAPARACC